MTPGHRESSTDSPQRTPSHLRRLVGKAKADLWDLWRRFCEAYRQLRQEISYTNQRTHGSSQDVASVEGCHLEALAYLTEKRVAPESAAPKAVPSGVETVGPDEPWRGQRDVSANGREEHRDGTRFIGGTSIDHGDGQREGGAMTGKARAGEASTRAAKYEVRATMASLSIKSRKL